MKRVRTNLFFMAVVGIAVTSITTSVYGAENLVVNGGFEVSEDTDGRWPSSYGDWHGDYSSIVGPSSGIAPLEGSRMLQFRGCGWGTRPGSVTGCEVPQIVDVSQFKDVIAAGWAIASGSAYFNRVAGDAQTDTLLRITICAYEGDPSSYPSQRENGIYLDRVVGVIYSDSDPATWERCEAALLVPANTDFVTIQVCASENIYNDTSGIEFDGHFADEVWLEIISEPVMLVALEIVGPGEVAENFSASYKAIAHYDNDSTRNVTDSALWVVEPNTAANIDENGILTTKDIVKHRSATILASYTKGDVTVDAEKAIDILAICPSGTALSFDGVDDYVDVGDLDGVVGSNPFTITSWVYPRLISGSNKGILTKASGRNSNNCQILIRITYAANFEGIFSDGSTFGNIITSDETIPLNAWTFLVFSWDGTTGPNGMKLYMNGILGKTRQSTVSSIQDIDNPAFIGAFSNAGTPLNYFNGTIDDVRIYDGALSAEEIQANMHRRLTGDEPGLVGYWDFDEGEGQIVYDLSGNGNDGQLGSTPNADNSDPAWVESDAPVGICTNIAIDIKPGSCPNPLNLASKGILPVAILGSEGFDVSQIDAASVRLAGVAPIRSSYEDVATPVSDGNECDCTTEGPDGYTDLTLKFRTQEIVEELVNAQGELADGEVLVLTLMGVLSDQTPIEGADCIVLVGNVPKALAAKRWDYNGDGIVNILDFAELATYWLESTVY